MGEFRRHQFLSEKDHPTQRVRCPVHGFIHYSENEREIIDHRLFRRLRYVRQLAFSEYIYPGATHTRFEHSLGVMEVATQAFDSLAARGGKKMEARFQDIPEFKDKPLAKARQAVRIAALVHDIGHAPFSHAAEVAISDEFDHEELTVKIVRSEGVNGLKDLLDRRFWDGCADLVGKIISKTVAPQIQILVDLITGEMDADRTDYLLRDSLHCGVDYGRFDFKRLIESLDLWEDPTGRLEIAIQRGGIHAFEALILARYQMNTQVYYHRLRRIYDYYLRNYIESMDSSVFNSPEKIVEENDITVMKRIFEDAENGEGPRRKWAKRIVDRNHHRLVYQTGVTGDIFGIRNAKAAYEQLKVEYEEGFLVWDIPNPPPKIHKILVSGQDTYKEDTSIGMHVTVPGGEKRLVYQESQVFASIPKQFQNAMVFADTGSSRSNAHTEIQEKFEDLRRAQ